MSQGPAFFASTLAAAKSFSFSGVPISGQIMAVAGRATAGDGYQGLFSYASGDTTTTFDQDGVGFVDASNRRWFRLIDESISVDWFGAVGDGVTDDLVAFDALTTFCNGNPNKVAILTSGKTYMITDTWTLPRDTTITGYGAVLDGSSFTGNVTNLFGSLGTSTNVTATTIEGSYTISVASGSGYSDGDFVLIGDSTHYYPYSGTNIPVGEVLQVRSSTSTSLTFRTPVTAAYLTSAQVFKVNWKTGLHLKGLTILGNASLTTTVRGIYLRYVQDFSIEDCVLVDQMTAQIQAESCILGEIFGNTCDGVFYDGVTGSNFYGIAILNATQWTNVHHNIGDRNRHLVVSTSSTGGYGQPMFCHITDNNMRNAEAGGPGASFAYEVHGFGRFLIISRNIADGAFALLRLENANDCLAESNVIFGYDNAGIVIGSHGLLNKNIVCRGNKMARYTDVSIGNTGHAAYSFDTVADGTVFDNILIEDMDVTNAFSSGTTVGRVVQFAAVGSVTSSRIVIRGGHASSGVTDANLSAIDIPAGFTDVEINGLTIDGYRSGVDSSAASTRVKNCTFQNGTLAGSGTGVDVGGDSSQVIGNTFSHINTPVAVSGTAASCMVRGNIFDTTSAGPVTLGTGANNDVGGNRFVAQPLTASATFNPPSLTAGTQTSVQTMTVTGAAPGDFVTMSFSVSLAGLSLSGYVSAANTVSYFFNNGTTSTVDIASGTVRTVVQKQNY